MVAIVVTVNVKTQNVDMEAEKTSLKTETLAKKPKSYKEQKTDSESNKQQNRSMQPTSEGHKP